LAVEVAAAYCSALRRDNGITATPLRNF